MGPSLRTWELAAWRCARGLSAADEEQLRAVFDERDRLLYALEEVTVDVEARAATFMGDPGLEARKARLLIQEVSP